MNPKLEILKTAKENAETLTQLVAALEAEELDLRVNPNKARSEALPAELKAARDERDSAINALQLALREIPALVIENKTGQHAAAEELTREFLQTHLVDSRQIHGYEAFVEDLIHKIASNFKAVRLADDLVSRFASHRFSLVNSDRPVHPPELFALANDCLESLAEI